MPQFGVDVVPMVGPGHVVADWLRECGVREIVETRHFPGGWKKQRGFGRTTLPYRYLECGMHARAEIERLVASHQIEVILASLPFAWITGGIVARQGRMPIVWRAGGSYLNAAQKLGLWGLTRVLSPDLLLCNSHAVENTFSPLIPAPVEVVPNGFDQRRFHPLAGDARKYRPPGSRYVVGCAMRLADSKRPEDFVALAAALRQRRPDVRFLLAGEGSRRADLEQVARRMGADNLAFLGFVSDMPSFHAACDLLVLPSRSEGCSNFMLEAAAMGKPTVAAAIPPVIELARATESSVLFELGDVRGLVSTVAQLLASPERLEALGARGAAQAGRFTARACAARISAILRALVHEHRARRDPGRAASSRLHRPGPDRVKEAAE